MIKKNNLKQTLDRLLAFYERRLENGILAAVNVAPQASAGRTAVEAGETKTRNCLLLEDLEGYFLRQKESLDNCEEEALTDGICIVYPTFNFGESIWSGMLGGDIIFSGNNLHTWSFCPKPVIQSVDEFDFPEIKKDNFWFNQMLRVTGYFAEHLDPVCDIYHFTFMDCLDLLVDLRGAAAYTDLYDCPDFVRKFLDWSVAENIKVFDAQASLTKDLVKKAFGGHPCYKYANVNMPSISVDAYGLCRQEIFESFGREQKKRIVDYYGGAELHIHGNGRHLCKLVAKIEKISLRVFTEDVGYQHPYEIVEELKNLMYPIPIRIAIPKEVFIKRLRARTLPGGVFYKVTEAARNLNEANEIMRMVFDYQPRSGP